MSSSGIDALKNSCKKETEEFYHWTYLRAGVHERNKSLLSFKFPFPKVMCNVGCKHDYCLSYTNPRTATCWVC